MDISNLLHQEVTNGLFKRTNDNVVNDSYQEYLRECENSNWGVWVLGKVFDVLLIPVNTFNAFSDAIYWVLTGEWANTKENQTVESEDAERNRLREELKQMESLNADNNNPLGENNLA